MRSPAVRHDTRACKARVRISFAPAAGLAGLPGHGVDRAFMVMAMRDARDGR